MSPGEDNKVDLPGLALVENQASQLHHDLSVLISAGAAGTSSIDWIRSLYSGLLARARRIIDAHVLAHLGEPDALVDVVEVYLAVGQIASVARAFVDEAARQEQAPLGFRPPDKEL